ncbi:MAG: DUF4174 domain-containing protein [Salinibacter sp.]|uniref:DUF4174 domain-containing protein n=1 Tax=Salinibacter sp. TaxID=2065818 RepID=UPI0035D49780
MIPSTLVCLLALLPIGSMAAPPSDSVDFRLERHQWEHRLLFVFAPADAGDALPRQEEQFRGRDEGFRDRDLLLVTVRGTEQGTRREQPGADPRPLTEGAARRLRERFSVPPDSFRVVLVGKDGTEKRRDPEPVAARSLFDTIDAMPMRQREMREQGNGGG